MTAPAKFLFDDDFSRSAKHESGTGLSVQRQAALAEAEARGYAAGRADRATDGDHRLAAAFDRTAAALETLVGGLKAVEGRLEAEAVEVAVAVATKLAPALLKREPFAEIAALAAECFRHLVGTPHVVVRVSDELYKGARAKLAEIASAGGFEGRLVVLAETEIEPSDCRIE